MVSDHLKHTARAGMSFLQVFVTKNEVLCKEVKESFQSQLCTERIFGHHVDKQEYKRPHRFQVGMVSFSL